MPDDAHADDTAVVLWPTSAIEGAMGHIDKLYGIIDRADAQLELVPMDALERFAEILSSQSEAKGSLILSFTKDSSQFASVLLSMARGVRQARSILGESDPKDMEASDG